MVYTDNPPISQANQYPVDTVTVLPSQQFSSGIGPLLVKTTTTTPRNVILTDMEPQEAGFDPLK